MELKDRIVAKVREIEEGEGVLIFVDLFAGTPCNMTALALAELSDIPIQCFAGVNLPLVMGFELAEPGRSEFHYGASQRSGAGNHVGFRKKLEL